MRRSEEEKTAVLARNAPSLLAEALEAAERRARGDYSKPRRRGPSRADRVLVVEPNASLITPSPAEVAGPPSVAPEESGEQIPQRSEEALLLDVAGDSGALRTAPGHLRADPAFMLAAVARNAAALQHASPELQADRAFLAAVLDRDGLALQYTVLAQRDADLVLRAVENSAPALRFAAQALRQSRAFVFDAVRRNPAALACSEFRHDVGMVLHAMEVDPAAVDLRSASERLRTTVAARWALRGALTEAPTRPGGRCPWCSPEVECPVTLTWARVSLVLMHAASPGAKQVDGIPGMRDRIVGWL